MADAAGNRYGPYDIEVPGSEAEALTEDAWFDLFGDISGVKSGGALTFAGLTATLAAIDVRVHGSYLIREDPWSAASAATGTASPRRDMLVARRQRTSGEGEAAVPGKTFLTILQGTPAATPAEPASYDPLNDESLHSWQVPGSGGTVVTDIRDLRRFKDSWTEISGAGGTAYSQALAAGSAFTALPGMSAEVIVPAGRTLDVEWKAPSVQAAAATNADIRLQIGGVTEDAIQLSTNSVPVFMPGRLTGEIVGTGASVSIAVQGRAPAGSAVVVGAGVSNVKLRYRLQ